MRRVIPIVILLALAASSCTRRQEPVPEPTEPISVVALLRQQRGELSEWQKLMLAIAFTESRFNPDAVGKAGDYGCLQITPVYVREANRVSGANYCHEDAFDIEMSLAMFTAIQDEYNPQRDMELAIRLHNKSAAYRRAVLDNLAMIERMETFRAKVIER